MQLEGLSFQPSQPVPSVTTLCSGPCPVQQRLGDKGTQEPRRVTQAAKPHRCPGHRRPHSAWNRCGVLSTLAGAEVRAAPLGLRGPEEVGAMAACLSP